MRVPSFQRSIAAPPQSAELCAAPLPQKPLDGVDIGPLFAGQQDVVDRDVLLYFDGWHIQCARLGKWKLHVARYNTPPWGPEPAGGRVNLPLQNPELYDLDADPGECYDVSENYPQVVATIMARIGALIPGFPDEVRSAWKATQSIKVDYTPPGALPIRKLP
jgi:hypothetical protein